MHFNLFRIRATLLAVQAAVAERAQRRLTGRHISSMPVDFDEMAELNHVPWPHLDF